MKSLRKIAIAIAVSMAFTPMINAQKIKGSDTVLPLSQKEAEAYGKKGDYLTGANIAGFLKVAKAMVAYGIV